MRVPLSEKGRAAIVVGVIGVAAAGCASAGPAMRADMPGVVPGAAWRSEAPVGHDADAMRRNLAPGDSLEFGDLWLRVDATLRPVEGAAGSGGGAPVAILTLRSGDGETDVRIAAGSAVRWSGHRVAVLSAAPTGELGGGLVALEVATLSSLPPELASSEVAGGAEMRLRVPHEITHVTLHHSGSPQPLRPEDDPVEKLRGLQRWGRTDRNWWDVPYHFLIDLDGRIYEGRDWRYMGETNTAYDPWGHLLISVIGNYDQQEATPAQIEAITALMAWAVSQHDVPLDRIGGHYDYAATSCPGTHLVRYLEDGTFRRGVEAALRN